MWISWMLWSMLLHRKLKVWVVVSFPVIDVNAILAGIVESRTIPEGFASCSPLANLNINSTALNIPSYNCNQQELSVFDLSYFKKLETVYVDSNAAKWAGTFYIGGLPRLRSIYIGFRSFTLYPNDQAINRTRTFLVENCVQLKTIEISPFSFTDYSGSFEIRNLPLLQSLVIGSMYILHYSYIGAFCPFRLYSIFIMLFSFF